MRYTATLFCILSFTALVAAQSTTQSGFVGIFTFQNFSTGGTADVVGDLFGFTDQTQQFNANNVTVGDVVWDNSGNRWEVMLVNSSNITSANVDLRDINSAGGTPSGVGAISRETTNLGLSLFVPDNSIGISQQLKSRIETHNMILIDQYLGNILVTETQQLGDTIYQVDHGFQPTNLVSQLPGNGDYFTANSASADSFPVAMVVENLHPDTFIVAGSGWIYDVSTSFLPGRDYFLQEDGNLDTIPASTNIFAFRVFKTGKVYFDVPELSVLGQGGGSGSDKDGIYTGSGNVAAGTIATAPDFRFQSGSNQFHVDLDRGNILLDSDSTVIESASLPQLIFRGPTYRWRMQGTLFWRLYNLDDLNFPLSIHRTAPNNSLELDDLGNVTFSQYSTARAFFTGRSAGRPAFAGTGQIERTAELSYNHDAPAAGTLDNTYATIRLEFGGTYTLPDPANNAGKLFILVADENTSGVTTRTVDVANAGTIDGAASLTFDTAREVYGVVSNGTEYIILWNKS